MIKGKSRKIARILLLKYATELGKNFCFRCGRIISSIEEMSVDHIVPISVNLSLVFDADNLTLSHLSCNIGVKSNNADVQGYYLRTGHRKCGKCDRTDDIVEFRRRAGNLCIDCSSQHDIMRNSLGRTRNKMFDTPFGKMSGYELSQKYNISSDLFAKRQRIGLRFEECIKQPTDYNQMFIDRLGITITEFIASYPLSQTTVYNRLNNGWTVDMLIEYNYRFLPYHSIDVIKDNHG